MLTRTLSTLLRLRVTVTYSTALVAIATALVVLGPRVQDHVIRHMSTNLHNLAHGQLGTLIGSAFVAADGPMWVWLPVGLLVVCTNSDFTDVGHVVALLLGMLVSVRFATVVRWTRVHVALLMVGVSFGYLVLVHTGPAVVAAPVVGVAGALAAHWLAGRFKGRRVRPAPPVAAAATT